MKKYGIIIGFAVVAGVTDGVVQAGLGWPFSFSFAFGLWAGMIVKQMEMKALIVEARDIVASLRGQR